jgi:hypothetical protein
MVANIAQQQKAKDAINGEHNAPYVGNRVDKQINDGKADLDKEAQKDLFNYLSGKSKKIPTKDIVKPKGKK